VELTDLWRQLTQKPKPSDTNGIYRYAISLFLQMARIQFFYDGNKRTGRAICKNRLMAYR
jgi:Fic family protein